MVVALLGIALRAAQGFIPINSSIKHFPATPICRSHNRSEAKQVRGRVEIPVNMSGRYRN